VAVAPGAPTHCHLLREDPELADAIPVPRRREAIEECLAREVRIPTGGWPPDIFAGGIGLLVLGGLIVRRVGVHGRYGAELIGQGDVLRPWQAMPETATPLDVTTSWSIVDPVRIAVLGDEFMPYVVRYPELATCLISRAIQRSRNLVVNIAIIHQARVDVRLHMLLWHLAARWGRVRSDGTVLPLRLTHNVLADLVAARRPTVTSALSELSRRGLVRFADDVWLLTGGPPGVVSDKPD